MIPQWVRELLRKIMRHHGFEIEKKRFERSFRRQLWDEEFWEDGCVVRTVGDKVTAGVIGKYLRFHEAKK